MLRSLGVLMSALVAVSAQAQDASTPKDEEKPAPAAPPAENEQSPVVVASTGRPVESGRPPPPASAPPAKPDTEVDASTPEEPNDCGIEQSFYDETDVPVAVRFYDPGPPNLAGQQQAWVVPPDVRRAGRCLRKYVILVKSESKQPWVVKDAKLVGSDGEVLEVTGIRPRKAPQNASVNIITAVKTEGVAAPNYRLRIILLTGEDGRAIVLENVDLP